MKVSDGLKAEAKRLQKSGSFKLNVPQKRELADYNKENGLRELSNLGCSTCVRDSLYSFAKHLDTYKDAPVLQKLDMQKKPRDMKFPELKSFCKAKGIAFKRSDKKADLIDKSNDYLGIV